MSFDKAILADSNVFENLTIIPVGDFIKLIPLTCLDKNELFNESEQFLRVTNAENIKKYLPLTYVSTLEEARSKLQILYERMFVKASITYAIKEKEFTLGYININSPLARTGLDAWNCDFWIYEKAQNRGLASYVLPPVLEFLQRSLVPEVLAIVDTDNNKSIATLERIGFNLIKTKNDVRLLYGVTLNIPPNIASTVTMST